MTLYNAAITAIAKHAPEKVLTNDDLAKIVDTSDEWIQTRTGIKRRHVHEGPTSDMAVDALRKALDQRGMTPDELDLIIVCTATPDHFFPSTACMVQTKIGATKAWGFDLSAACSGFLYGLSVASDMIKSGSQERIAVIGAESATTFMDWNQRETCVLFGDGAGAAIVERSEKPSIGNFRLYCDGAKGELLAMPAGGSAMPITQEVLDNKQNYIVMNGREVFKHAVTGMTEVCIELMTAEGMSFDDVNLFVTHQANLRIIEAVRQRLQVPEEKCYTNVHEYGNTSAASIPLCLSEIHEQKLAKKGDTILLAAFGGGFTWGAGLMTWELD